MSAEIFENIEVKNLVDLYNILENNLEYLDNAKLQYSKQNTYLRDSLNFLIEIDLISVSGNNIKIHDPSSGEIEDKIFNKIAESSEFGLEVKEYLNNFVNINGSYSFKPDAIYNNATSHLRNFLIYAKKIVYENNEYKVVDNEILELFLKKEYSPKKLEKDLKDKKQLGDETLASQLASVSTQEKFAQALSKLQEVFVSIVTPLMPLLSAVGSLATGIGKILSMIPLELLAGLVGFMVGGPLGAAIGVGATLSQRVDDGMAPASKGPFTITDGFGETAITAKGDSLAVSPNISREDNRKQWQKC